MFEELDILPFSQHLLEVLFLLLLTESVYEGFFNHGVLLKEHLLLNGHQEGTSVLGLKKTLDQTVKICGLCHHAKVQERFHDVLHFILVCWEHLGLFLQLIEKEIFFEGRTFLDSTLLAKLLALSLFLGSLSHGLLGCL